MLKVLLHKLFCLLFLMGLFLTGPFSYAQAPDLEVQTEQLKEELNTVLADDPTVANTDTVNAAQVVTKEEVQVYTPPKQIALKDLNPELMTKMLAPFQQMSEPELNKLLKETLKDSMFGAYLNKYPQIAVFVVRLIRDKHALINLVKIVHNKTRSLHYFYAMIGTLFLGLIFAKILKNSDGGIFAVFILFCFRFSVMTVIRLWVTYYFFAIELDPIIKIFNKTFL